MKTKTLCILVSIVLLGISCKKENETPDRTPPKISNISGKIEVNQDKQSLGWEASECSVNVFEKGGFWNTVTQTKDSYTFKVVKTIGDSLYIKYDLSAINTTANTTWKGDTIIGIKIALETTVLPTISMNPK